MRTAIGITGNVGAVDPRTLEVLPGVMELIRVTKPFKLASREFHEEDSVVMVGGGARSEAVHLPARSVPTTPCLVGRSAHARRRRLWTKSST